VAGDGRRRSGVRRRHPTEVNTGAPLSAYEPRHTGARPGPTRPHASRARTMRAG
jgi:hypothetical protein